MLRFEKEFKAQQYKAWCKNNGHHKTAKRAEYSWNLDLVQVVEAELLHDWYAFDTKLKEAGRECAESLTSLINSIRDGVKGEVFLQRQLSNTLTVDSEVRGLSPKTIEPFLMSLSSKRPLLDDLCSSATTVLQEVSE